MKPKILAVIPARGGSKGVLRKNIRDLAGKPLLAWTIEEANKSHYIDHVILSSEDMEIIEVAKQYGCDVPFVRPIELAQDDTPGIEPVIHAIKQCPGYEYVVILQPTSPLRTAEQIDECIAYMLEKQADFCVSVTEPDHSPYWMYTLNEGAMEPLIPQTQTIARRQDLPKVYALNGAIYVGRTENILIEQTFLTSKTKGYVMPTMNSLDIDTALDFQICSILLKERVN